jgi:hypothetical protein
MMKWSLLDDDAHEVKLFPFVLSTFRFDSLTVFNSLCDRLSVMQLEAIRSVHVRVESIYSGVFGSIRLLGIMKEAHITFEQMLPNFKQILLDFEVATSDSFYHREARANVRRLLVNGWIGEILWGWRKAASNAIEFWWAQNGLGGGLTMCAC